MDFTIPCIGFILCLYGASTDNTTDYIHQLELKISGLESHSLALEQKQTAVLSSILTRIESQDQKIQSQEQKILSQEQMIQELKIELENATKSDSNSVSKPGLQPVVFEARTSHDLPRVSKILFNQVSTNIGGAYSSKTGVFTAPRNGTYQIWFSVNLDLITMFDGPVVKVTGGAGGTVYGSYVAPTQTNTNNHYHHSVYKVLQGVLAVSLTKGDPVYLTLNHQTAVKTDSTFGGVFLGDAGSR